MNTNKEFRDVILKIKDTVVITMASIMFIALIIYGIGSYRVRDDFCSIAANPTFVGVVVRRGFSEPTSAFGPSNTMYLLHINGEYGENDTRVLIDHVFVVSAEIYRRFQVGDIISYETVSGVFAVSLWQ